MGWRRMEVQEQRVRFVVAASRGGQSFRRLCAEFGISRPSGYLWLSRYRACGVAGIVEQSRRPHHSPLQTAAEVEERIEHLRRQWPDWGGDVDRTVWWHRDTRLSRFGGGNAGANSGAVCSKSRATTEQRGGGESKSA